MTDSEIIGTQNYVNVHLFDQWCINFFDITNRIERERQSDAHHCRWFYIALWELFTSGERYIDDQLSLPCNSDCIYLKVAKDYIEKLKSLFDDTDYFMLQYYRHSSAHIFQSEYSLIDKNKTPKTSVRTSTFVSKTGAKNNKLTQQEIRAEAQKVLNKYGLHESLYRQGLISRTYATIKEWAQKHAEILNKLSSGK